MLPSVEIRMLDINSSLQDTALNERYADPFRIYLCKQVHKVNALNLDLNDEGDYLPHFK